MRRLLGLGDWSGFMDKIGEAIPSAAKAETLQKLSEGQFTLRMMREQYQNILKMGNIGQVRGRCCALPSQVSRFGQFVKEPPPPKTKSALCR